MTNKQLILIVIFGMASCFMVSFTNDAQNSLIAKIDNEGIYLSSNDFTRGKISFVNNQNKKYKLYLHETFNTSAIKIVIGNSITKLNKDSIFGYRDKNNTCYRFYNKVTYKIINPSEKILLYSRTSSEGGYRYNHQVTNYFFSLNPNSRIYPLTKWNLKTVFFNDDSYIKLLDIYFNNDHELITYDYINKIYFLNRIYEIRKEAIARINN